MGRHYPLLFLSFTCNITYLAPIVWFQKISIPLPQMVLPIRPLHPLGISVSEGSCITPHPPGISYFPFHGLNLPYLEIIDRVPLKINCSHFKTHVFYNLWPICNLLQGLCISYTGRARLIGYEQSLFFISPSSETCEAREQRLISLCHVISRKHLEHNFKFELFIEIKLCEHFRISKRIYLQTKLMSGIVIK